MMHRRIVSRGWKAESVSDAPHPVCSPSVAQVSLVTRSTDELEALLREKDKALNSFNAGSSRSNASSFSAPIQVLTLPSSAHLGMLSSFGASPAVSPDVDLFASSQQMDEHGGMDFSQYQGGSSLDNLAGVASMLGTDSIDPQFGQSDINRNVMANGMTASYTPSTGSHDLVYLAWPQNLPTQEVTHHL